MGVIKLMFLDSVIVDGQLIYGIASLCSGVSLPEWGVLDWLILAHSVSVGIKLQDIK